MVSRLQLFTSDVSTGRAWPALEMGMQNAHLTLREYMKTQIAAVVATLFAGAAFAQTPAAQAVTTSPVPATKAEVRTEAKVEKAEAKADAKIAVAKADEKVSVVKADAKAEKSDAKAHKKANVKIAEAKKDLHEVKVDAAKK
jgi:hypothetical protein